MKTILQRLGSDIQVVELNQWVHMLEQIDQTDTRQLASKPAAKNLDCFGAFETVKREGKVYFGTRPMQLPLARLMAGLKLVNPGWMDIWLNQWEESCESSFKAAE